MICVDKINVKHFDVGRAGIGKPEPSPRSTAYYGQPTRRVQQYSNVGSMVRSMVVKTVAVVVGSESEIRCLHPILLDFMVSHLVPFDTTIFLAHRLALSTLALSTMAFYGQPTSSIQQYNNVGSMVRSMVVKVVVVKLHPPRTTRETLRRRRITNRSTPTSHLRRESSSVTSRFPQSPIMSQLKLTSCYSVSCLARVSKTVL